MRNHVPRRDWPRVTSKPILNLLGAVLELAFIDAALPDHLIQTRQQWMLREDAKDFLRESDLLSALIENANIYIPPDAEPVCIRQRNIWRHIYEKHPSAMPDYRRHYPKKGLAYAARSSTTVAQQPESAH